MANINCEACDELRQEDPSLILNGFSDSECTSLKNDTGLVPSAGHNDCTDLNNMNDCMVGNMATEVSAYDVCDWKPFMQKFIPNLWTVLKAIICAICGIWTNIHNIWDEIARIWTKLNCVYNGIKNLINALNSSTMGTSFVRYYRDNSGQGGDQYWWNATEGSSHILDIYMDANVDNPGTQAADRDYVVMVSNCTNFEDGTTTLFTDVTFYSSGETTPIETLRLRRAQHPGYDGPTIQDFSWTTSGAVIVRKGEHLKVEGYVEQASGSNKWRLHQFVLTWIPINAGSSPLDPSSILPC